MQDRTKTGADVANRTKVARHRRVTATEMIAGTPCRITLEQDDKGQYREVLLTPLDEESLVGT